MAMTLATHTAPDTDMDTPPEHRSAASTDAVPPMARHGRVIDEPPVVLVVDDDRALCAALQRAFLRQGWQVYCANTYAEALARCRMVRPDVLLTDQALPDGAGLDLLQALLATDPDLAGILMSAYADIAITVDAMRAGAVTVLAKPLALDYLVEVVTRAAQIARLRRRDRLSQLHPGTLDALDALGHCRRMRDVAQELLTLAPDGHRCCCRARRHRQRARRQTAASAFSATPGTVRGTELRQSHSRTVRERTAGTRAGRVHRREGHEARVARTG